MQEFFKNTLQSKLIQSILYNTPLPIFKTISDGDYIVKGIIYIYKTDIIKCTESGYFKETAQIEKLDDFKFGVEKVRVTDNFVPIDNYYDSYTHERLGDYLSCIKHLFDLDLMPFYNCNNNEFSGNLSIASTTDSAGETTYYVKESKSKNKVYSPYKIVKVPIKYNQKYTIALNCASRVIIAPVLSINDCLLSWGTVGDESDKTQLLNQKNTNGSSNIKIFNGCFFNKPFTYEVTFPDTLTEDEITQLAQYEKNLYMLIQIPINNTSQLTILEGDYLEAGMFPYMSVDRDISIKSLNKYCINDISLLRIDLQKAVPYSPRLIEFLLLNVICELDDISSNVLRAQEYTGILNGKSNIVPSVWMNEFRYFLYYTYMKSFRTNKSEVTGYIDKDMEAYLNFLKVKNGY